MEPKWNHFKVDKDICIRRLYKIIKPIHVRTIFCKYENN